MLLGVSAINLIIERGGWVMWPLTALSVIALTLIFERAWFWIATNNPWRNHRLRRVGEHLRAGRRPEAIALLEGDRSPYGKTIRQIIDAPESSANIADAVESQRNRLERFMPTLGTIITAAPLLGILGTVTGIITTFKVLSETESITDARALGGGIAEALLTTVAGLVIALVVLFPYNAFRAQIDRTLGRLDALVAAASDDEGK